MDSTKASRAKSRTPGATILVLLVVVCLAESASGGCNNYGHSCWGAHGKRSAPPDWYMRRMLNRIAADDDVNRDRQLPANNDDISAIFQVEEPNDAANEKTMSEMEDINFQSAPRGLGAKPMLDDDLLSKIKIWQIMREASQEN